MCNLHNEVFGGAETRINTECFLPVWEGVSYEDYVDYDELEFPPCMGGCIAVIDEQERGAGVSSLYGRVYRFLLRF